MVVVVLAGKLGRCGLTINKVGAGAKLDQGELARGNVQMQVVRIEAVSVLC